MIHMSGPRRAQTMVNKEEKMRQKMNLEKNGNMYAEKSERLTEKQTIKTEATEKSNQRSQHRHRRSLPQPHGNTHQTL